jgi:thiaminase
MAPSLTNHLLKSNHALFTAATNQSFLSHAGCGTLSSAALAQWMNQDNHYTRAYIQFVGSLIGKLRLPIIANSQFHPMYRTLDLLISAINNIRREMGFFENTAMKYGINLTEETPNFITRAYMDLFEAVSAPSASLLEGMLVLWATGHVS